MTYNQTIDYLFAKLPMFSRIGSAAIKKDLHNTIEICKQLGDPQSKFPSVHIAGTNGKGSVSHMLAAILQSAGYKTGLYTSPHLYDFRERIKVNGAMVPEEFVIDFTEKMIGTIETIEPSFFEITVAMAFEYFAEEKVDIAIIETGLGGRLDSTNVITPVLSVITNVGWDHMNILGDSLEKIAAEKAGIIKKGIPVVIGETQNESENIFTITAEKLSSQVFYADKLFKVKKYSLQEEKLVVDITQANDVSFNTYKLDLPGIYQLKNLSTVLMAVSVLKNDGWDKITDDSIQHGLSQAKSITGLHGRWEKISEEPLLILEAAHNKNGVEEMLRQLEQLDYNKVHFIVGTVKDKDPEAILQLLPKDAIYYFTQAHIPRALAADTLKEIARKSGLTGNVYENVNAAIESARIVAAKDDIIIVCGSIFLLAEVDRNRWTYRRTSN